MPLVSVLLPVYNGAAFVRDAIESVLAQTFRDFEFIIVDNASTDGTGEVISEYTGDPRIKLFRNEKTIFRLENFMKVAACASPESRWLKYIGADDILFPDCLEKMLGAASLDEHIGLVSSQCYDGDRLLLGALSQEQEVVSGPDILRRLLLEKETRETIFSPASLMLSHEAFSRYGGFRTDLNHSDTELFYLILNDYNLAFVHRPLSRTGQNPGSGMSYCLEQGTPFSEGYIIFYDNLKRYTNVKLNFCEVEKIKYALAVDSTGFLLRKIRQGDFKAVRSHLKQVPFAVSYHFIPALFYFLFLAVKKLIRGERFHLISDKQELVS